MASKGGQSGLQIISPFGSFLNRGNDIFFIITERVVWILRLHAAKVVLPLSGLLHAQAKLKGILHCNDSSMFQILLLEYHPQFPKT